MKVKEAVTIIGKEFDTMINRIVVSNSGITAPLINMCLVDLVMQMDENVNAANIRIITKRLKQDVMGAIKRDAENLSVSDGLNDIAYLTDTLDDMIR